MLSTEERGTPGPSFKEILDQLLTEVEALAAKTRKVTRSEIPLNENLFEAGYVDSVGAVELFLFIEETFGVQIEDHELFSDEFTHLQGMAHLVWRKTTKQLNLE
ncbi:MAG: acyl carrier protein [Chloroflexi bacterium]|nr:acyl carrier protein [Chloroflexota bacterium]